MRVRPEDITPETMVIPIAVALVMENFEELAESYHAARVRGDRPTAAVETAIALVLSDKEAMQVLTYIRGNDDRFEKDKCVAFAQTTVDHFERCFASKHGLDLILSQAPEGRSTPQPTDDIVNLAEWIAGNKQTSYVYSHTLKDYPDLSKKILGSAVQDLLEIASRAWTKTGRSVKVEQARKVISLLGHKAAVNPDPLAVNQVIWCEALLSALPK